MANLQRKTTLNYLDKFNEVSPLVPDMLNGNGFRRMEELGEEGNMGAKYAMVEANYAGICMDKDPINAFRIERSMVKENGFALVVLAELFYTGELLVFEGKKIEPDYRKARKYAQVIFKTLNDDPHVFTDLNKRDDLDCSKDPGKFVNNLKRQMREIVFQCDEILKPILGGNFEEATEQDAREMIGIDLKFNLNSAYKPFNAVGGTKAKAKKKTLKIDPVTIVFALLAVCSVVVVIMILTGNWKIIPGT